METGPNKQQRDAAPARSNVVKVLHWGDSPPQVICLCGASRFRSEFMAASKAFSLAGHIVVMPGVFDQPGSGFLNEETKRKLNDLQLKKIDMSDVVYVINPNGYISEATKREVEYAQSLNKIIRYYEPK